ncbi:hypothetical protein VPG91_11545 [Nitrospirillum amazonense]|uniref:hypothetical protein n=1 Tax=Nitrospirillum amazonense TaxID=28077 RepID=UPI002DD43972|nr:hypothetical protein [Nitrospirillum amazonense]MEC4591623.1 hypothetical protein [Nitrospirillum amazonense]
MARRSIDWEGVERDYRAGVLTNTQIAKIYGCTESAVRGRAKAHAWKKDLTDQVRREAQVQLSRADVCDLEDQQIIAGGAALRVAVVLRHRASIAKLDALKERLASKAEGVVEAVTNGVTLKDAVQSIEGLARTAAKLIELERKAFGMDEPEPDNDQQADRTPLSEASDDDLIALQQRLADFERGSTGGPESQG